jgi:hypothetical protein
LSRSTPSLPPSAEAIRAERYRRAVAKLRRHYEELADPARPAWPASEDERHEAWCEEHWSEEAIASMMIERRAIYFESIDTVMGALALGAHECRADREALRRLFAGVGLPCWPDSAGGEEQRIFRRDHWGAWEGIYFERWMAWVILPIDERRQAHHAAWQQHLRNEGWTKDSRGSYWWNDCCAPNHCPQCIKVDLLAGLQFARARGHEADYPHIWDGGGER